MIAVTAPRFVCVEGVIALTVEDQRGGSGSRKKSQVRRILMHADDPQGPTVPFRDRQDHANLRVACQAGMSGAWCADRYAECTTMNWKWLSFTALAGLVACIVGLYLNNNAILARGRLLLPFRSSQLC